MRIIAVVLSVLKKVNAIIDKVLLTVSVLAFLGIILAITASVIARTPITPFTPLGWPEELSTFLFITLAFLGASCCAYRKREIVVDFMLAKIPQKLLRPLSIVIKVMIIGFLILVFIGSILLYPRIRGVTVALSIPRNWHYVPLLISAASMTLINIADLLEMLFPSLKEPEKGAE